MKKMHPKQIRKAVSWCLLAVCAAEVTLLFLHPEWVWIGVALSVVLVVAMILLADTAEEEEPAKVPVADEGIFTVLKGIADDYVCILDIDIEKKTELIYRHDGGGDERKWSAESVMFSEASVNYLTQTVCENDRTRVARELELNRLITRTASGKKYHLEYDVNLDGTRRHYDTIFRDHREGGDHIIISVRDVTGLVKERQENQISARLTTVAAGLIYPFIMEVNLTKDQAKIIHNTSPVRFGKMEVDGFRNLLEDTMSTMPDMPEQEKLNNVFSRDVLLDKYQQGYREIRKNVRQKGDDGVVRWMETTVILLTGDNGDIYCVTLVRPMDEKDLREEGEW